MPFIMGLEGHQAATPWAKLQHEAMMMMPRPFWRASARLDGAFGSLRRDTGPENCCWRCPCSSNVCCDSNSPLSVARHNLMQKMTMTRSRSLRGVFDPIKLHPAVAIFGLFVGGWLAGTKSGQAFVGRVRSGFHEGPARRR